MANSTRSPLPGRVTTLAPYCSAVSTCSSSAASWTSPQVPRVLTLVSTFLRSPTPAASVCISPSPLCTSSRRSLTSRKESPSRCSSVACSFSSTVRRISSSLPALSAWMADRRASTDWRNCSKRCSLLWVRRASCCAKASSCWPCSADNCPTWPASALASRSSACACSSRSPRAEPAASWRPRAISSRSSRSVRSRPRSRLFSRERKPGSSAAAWPAQRRSRMICSSSTATPTTNAPYSR